VKQQRDVFGDDPKNTGTPIDLSLIDDGVNMRTDFERLAEANEELVESILANGGVLQPVGVFPSGERFTLIFGQRRVHCSRRAGMTSIPARIFPPPRDDADLLILGTQENAHRIDANPVEFAEALKKIKRVRNWSSDEVAKAVCLKSVKVCRLLQLADQNEDLKQLVREGRLGLTIALELGKRSAAEQDILIPQIIAGQVTRDQLVGMRKRQRADSATIDRTGRRLSRATALVEKELTVSVAGIGLELESFITAIEQCLHAARRARTNGISLATFLRSLRDQHRGTHV